MKSTYKVAMGKSMGSVSRSMTTLISESRIHTKKEMIDVRQNAQRELKETYAILYGKSKY